MSFQNKTIIISGGASGIGAALVDGFVRSGAKVYSVDKKNPSKPIDGAKYLKADLTKPAEVEKAFEQIEGSIDVLLSGAGVMRRGTLFETTEEEYDFLMNCNVKTAWVFIKTAGPKLKENAVVAQIASRHALDLVHNPGIYALSKSAVATLAEIVRLTRPDLRVKIMYPGPVQTPLHQAGMTPKQLEQDKTRALKPEVMAEKIIDLIGSDYTELRFNNDTWSYEAR